MYCARGSGQKVSSSFSGCIYKKSPSTRVLPMGVCWWQYVQACLLMAWERGPNSRSSRNGLDSAKRNCRRSSYSFVIRQTRPVQLRMLSSYTLACPSVCRKVYGHLKQLHLACSTSMWWACYTVIPSRTSSALSTSVANLFVICHGHDEEGDLTCIWTGFCQQSALQPCWAYDYQGINLKCPFWLCKSFAKWARFCAASLQYLVDIQHCFFYVQ